MGGILQWVGAFLVPWAGAYLEVRTHYTLITANISIAYALYVRYEACDVYLDGRYT